MGKNDMLILLGVGAVGAYLFKDQLLGMIGGIGAGGVGETPTIDVSGTTPATGSSVFPPDTGGMQNQIEYPNLHVVNPGQYYSYTPPQFQPVGQYPTPHCPAGTTGVYPQCTPIPQTPGLTPEQLQAILAAELQNQQITIVGEPQQIINQPDYEYIIIYDKRTKKTKRVKRKKKKKSIINVNKIISQALGKKGKKVIFKSKAAELYDPDRIIVV